MITFHHLIISDFHCLMLDKLKPIMQHHGFNLASTYICTDYGIATFSRLTDYGTQELFFSSDKENGYFRVNFRLSAYYSPVMTSIIRTSLIEDFDSIFDIFDSQLAERNNIIYHNKDLEEHLVYLENYLLRFANETKKLIGLDALLNEEHEFSQKEFIECECGGLECFYILKSFLTVTKFANSAQHFDELSQLALKNHPELLNLVHNLNKLDSNEFWQAYQHKQEQSTKQEALRQQTLKDIYHLKSDDIADLGNQWLDKETNLIWQRTCYGQTLENGQWLISHDVVELEVEDALRLAEEAKVLGWRIPLKDEVIKLIAQIKGNPELQEIFLGEAYSINCEFFTQECTSFNPIKIKVLGFSDGVLDSLGYDQGYLRLVKSID